MEEDDEDGEASSICNADAGLKKSNKYQGCSWAVRVIKGVAGWGGDRPYDLGSEKAGKI